MTDTKRTRDGRKELCEVPDALCTHPGCDCPSVEVQRLTSINSELLEALERLRNEADLGGLREKAGWDSFLHAADEALAKARGES